MQPGEKKALLVKRADYKWANEKNSGSLSTVMNFKYPFQEHLGSSLKRGISLRLLL